MRKQKFFLTCLLTFLALAPAFGQNITVKGTVTDAASGEGVPFASIQVKGTMTGTATDGDGNYSITVARGASLIFSSIGYHTQEVAVEGRTTINVILATDAEALEETIVVAFGTTTKEAFTGSAAVMKSEQLQKRQTTNVANALVGQVAGLQMRGASGAPGAGAGSMSIRGIASMYASTDPLIIVDGAPYSANLSNIPQSDIESISVLKDAASAALYGARGAAGVIIITTKRSHSQDAVVNFDARVGVNTRSVQDYETITDPGEYYEAYYAQLYNQYFYGQGMAADQANVKANQRMIQDLGYQVFTVPSGQQIIGMNGRLNPSATLGYGIESNGETYWLQPDNWKDMAYKSALRQEYNLSINGGGPKSSFYASMGYLNEDGVIEYSGYQRLSARLKADYQVKKWLRVGGNVGYVNSKTTSNPNMNTSLGSTNLMYYTTAIAPIYPVYVRVLNEAGQPVIRTDANGNEQYDYGVAGADYPVNRAFLQTGNPLGSNRYNKAVQGGNQLNGTFTVDIDITKFLKANVTSTVNWGQTNASDYDNALYGPKVSVNGELAKSESTGFRTNNVQTLTYYQSFGEHNVNVMIGHEYYLTRSRYLSATARGIFTPEILEIAAAANKVTSNSYTSSYNVEGYFASAQYNYAQKYYVSGSFRRDASSRFAKENRWGNFWSAGVAWIANKEDFLSGASWIDLLKVKASVGQQGNDSIGNWNYIDMYSLSASSTYQMAPSFSSLGNPNITWETTTNMNIGAEFSFFKGRLSGNVDFYNKLATNQLFWLSVPEHAGARGYYGNMGDIRNLGFEVVLNGSLVRTKLVDWDVTFNASSNSTKILSLPESKLVDPANGVNGFTESSMWYKIGGPLYNAFRSVYAGTNEEGEALYWVDESLNGATNRPGKSFDSTTTNPNVATKYELGSILPKLFGGFGTSLRIGGFDASVTFDYQIGGKVYDSRYQNFMAPCADAGDAGSTFHKDWVRSWSVNNTSSEIPRWQYGDQYSVSASNRWLTDASYLNFQSFSCGYTLPKNLIPGISKLRIYAMGENLWFWSARKGLDPRYSFSGNTYVAVYSPVRTISGGIQLTF